jgi:hypothetical protein
MKEFISRMGFTFLFSATGTVIAAGAFSWDVPFWQQVIGGGFAGTLKALHVYADKRRLPDS